MTEPDITPRMAEVLRTLVRSDKPLTGNEIGSACGLRALRSTRNGKFQGPAQRVIGALNALRRRDLIGFGSRPDGRSGTAYTLTPKGRKFCQTWSL